MMQNNDSAKADKNLSNVIKIDEAEIQSHLGRMVRSTVQETLNDMLDAEADRLCNAKRYERTQERADGRAGHYKRKLHTKAGEVELKIPKLRKATFETAIIERYKRRESSVEEGVEQATGERFTANRIGNLRRYRKIARYRRSEDKGEGDLATIKKAAEILGVAPSTVHRWLADGFIAGEQPTFGAPWHIRMNDELRSRFVEEARAGFVVM